MPQQDSTTHALISEYCDNQELAELLQKFVAQLPERIQAIEQAVQDQDLVALSALAHKMKGVAGAYGFPTITDAARHLETSAKANEALETLAEHTRQLADLCHRARASASDTIG